MERHTDEAPEPEPESEEPEGAGAAAAEPELQPEGAVGGAVGGERRFSFELDKWEPPEDEGAYGGGGEP